MKKIATYIVFFCTLFAGCVNERLEDWPSSVIVRGNQIQCAGRAVEEHKQFQPGDIVSFFSQAGIEAENVRLTYKDGIWEHGGALEWNASGEAATYTAYYPSFESGEWEYYDEDGFLKDIVYAHGEVSSGMFIELKFQHLFSKITFKVDEKLNEQIQSLNAVTREQTQPVSASPEYNGESYEVKAEVYGTAVDIDVLTEKVKQYISEFRDELVLRDEGCYVLPAYTSSSPEVQEACDTMNKYIQASITYTMDDEDVVVDKDLISEWLSCDSEMQVTLDEDAVRQWMREFGKKYDTVGTTRTITTPTGKKAEVTGGTYGWSVNEDGETQTLIQNIKNGDVTSKEPAYKQTAASHSEQDWGNTYLEVDLSTQHMWYIKDGSVVLETDVVTGRPTDDRETPQGVYSIIEMKRDKVLTGSIDPATGEPSYRTPVSYWMRITWTGIGFHDATWQAQFGGDWYINHGSHGCINMPLSKASQLYEMLEMGTPAIVHY